MTGEKEFGERRYKQKRTEPALSAGSVFYKGESNAYLIIPSRRIRASMVGSLPLKRL